MKKLFEYLTLLIWGPKIDYLKEYRMKIKSLIERLMKAVESDNPALIKEIAPLNSNDKELIMMRQWLPEILYSYDLTDGETSYIDAIKECIQTLKEKELTDRHWIYIHIANKLYDCFSGKSPYEYNEIEEEFFKELI